MMLFDLLKMPHIALLDGNNSLIDWEYWEEDPEVIEFTEAYGTGYTLAYVRNQEIEFAYPESNSIFITILSYPFDDDTPTSTERYYVEAHFPFKAEQLTNHLLGLPYY